MAEEIADPRSDQPRTMPLRAAIGGLRRGFESLGVRNYRLYWLGQVVSLVGTWMQQVSLPWLVLSLGGSPLQLGFVSVLQFGPSLILAPFGGVVADRIDKRHMLIATQIGAASQAGILFVLTATGVVEIWMVMVMAFWLGLVNALDLPVRQALAADLVPRNLLSNAIALNSMAFNSARIVGPALAGVIIAAGTAPLGGLLAGALAQAFGAAFAISMGAILAVSVLALVAWQLRTVRMPRSDFAARAATERPREIARQAA